MNTNNDEFIMIEVTGDTGAVDHVMSPDAVPGCKVAESPGSRSGRGFIGPSGEKIENLGEMALDVLSDETGQELTATFQAADVTRALMSISKICDSGKDTKVSFDSREGVVTRRGRVLARFHRKGGLYVMKMRVRKPKETTHGTKSGFTRLGGKA